MKRFRDHAARHPVLVVGTLALALRASLVAARSLLGQSSMFLDDQTYYALAKEMAQGATASWNPYIHMLFHDTATFTFPLTAVDWLIGPSRTLNALMVAAAGAAVAALTALIGLRLWGRSAPAIAAGCVVAVLPSQVLFSSLVLKDAVIWAVLAALALVGTYLRSVSGRIYAARLLLAIMLLLALGYLRSNTLISVAVALLLTSWVGPAQGRVFRILSMTAVAVIVPWLVGLGPLGASYVTHAGSLTGHRSVSAQNAATALVPTTTTNPPHTSPPSGAATAPSPTPSTGHSGALLSEDSAAKNIRYLPRGILETLLGPDPRRLDHNRNLYLAEGEDILWYPLILLAVLGLGSVRRRPDLLLFPLLFVGSEIVVFALAEGNFGTAFRHRGETTWLIALLGVEGALQLVTRVRHRRSSDRTPASRVPERTEVPVH